MLDHLLELFLVSWGKTVMLFFITVLAESQNFDMLYFYFYLFLCKFWSLLLCIFWPNNCLVACCLITTYLCYFFQLCSYSFILYYCDQKIYSVCMTSIFLNLLRQFYAPLYGLSYNVLCALEKKVYSITGMF